MVFRTICAAAAALALFPVSLVQAQLGAAPGGASPVGYYRQPALHGELVVFVAEGDLWKVPLKGGVATRLTSHPGDEGQPAISPDGKTVAFTGQYEGPTEVYTMPVGGGLPTRWTFDGARAGVTGWTPDGKVLSSTDRFSTLPNVQLVTIDPKTGARERLPLEQASEGAIDPESKTLIFTRLPFQGSSTKRYKGGFIQHLWRFAPGDKEATELLKEFEGTAKRPMWWQGRVYFLTDRDGHMNLWSMKPDGADLKQHTRHQGFDVLGASLSDGKVVYQLGADLWVYDIAQDRAAMIPIALDSDFDQTRERWVEKPMDYLTSAHLSPDGDRVVLTARGRVFVAPHRQGRLVDVARDDGVRYRDARFSHDGQSVLVLGDKTGELEIWKLPANGIGTPEQLTSDGSVLRWAAVPSPDGKYIAHHDKNQVLWVYDTASKTSKKVDTQPYDDFSQLAWSHDSKWLAYVNQAKNMFKVIKLYNVETGVATQVTTDRYDHESPAWSPDGKWLYFLSERNLKTIVPSPWGPNQPDPALESTTKIYALALKPGERWPFSPRDEVQAARERAEKEKKEPTPGPTPTPPPTPTPKPDKPEKPDQPKQPVGNEPPKDDPKPAAADKPAEKKDDKKEEKKDEKAKPKLVEVVLEGIVERQYEVPVEPGNYGSLMATDKALFWLSSGRGFDRKTDLKAVEIKNENIEVKTVIADVAAAELSQDGKKMLVRKPGGGAMYIIDASPSPASDLDKKAVNLGGWTLSLTPRQQWRQMYVDSWRLMRDYFYDPKMHGVDWVAMRDKYLPLVDRVTTRAELSDVMAQMVGELSALHIFVRGGDLRTSPERIPAAGLGAELARDEAGGGWKVVRIYQCEPDDPGRVSPLAKPDVAVRVGDVIEAIDGQPTAPVVDIGQLLRHKAGRQVLVRIKPAKAEGGFGDARDAIVVPISPESERDLRYCDWELSRRKLVDEWSGGRIGYFHLRAMGGDNWTEFVKGYYPVFNREGLIVDVRHNNGGSIDSWVLSKLMRRAWFYWAPRVGEPYWNMQYAFRGHMAMVCNERSASDGEAVCEGFRRLGLGKTIGMRTWGGEIWLSSSNVLVDKGIASAAEIGVFGPEGTWLIEGRGFEPDIVVDNPPHATFKGEDAQLKAAVDHLLQQLKDKPVPPVTIPARPDKSFQNAPGAQREPAQGGKR